MTIDKEYTFDFHGAEIHAQREFHEIRKMAGDTQTDLVELFARTVQLYLNIRDPRWSETYLHLLDELKERMLMTGRLRRG